MKRVFPWLVIAVATLTISFPRSAAASVYEFNGAGGAGAVVWDDIFDVGTSNSNCFGASDCFTVPFSAILDPLTVVVSGAAPDLTFNALYLLFSFAVGDVNCDDFTYCGTLVDLNDPLNKLNPVLGGMGVDFNEVGGSSAAAPGTLLIVAKQILFGPVAISDGPIIPPDQDSSGSPDYLDGLPLALLPNTRVGFAVRYQQANVDDFTLTIPTRTAVPEPTSLILLGSGLAGAIARRHRRRTKNTAA